MIEKEEVCPYCYGNNKSRPCAYPSENKPGCLRDKYFKVLTEKLSSLKDLEHANNDWTSSNNGWINLDDWGYTMGYLPYVNYLFTCV